VALTIGESNDTVLGKIRDAINGKFKNLSASVAGGRLTITNNDLSTITFAAFNPSNLFTSIGLATSVTAGNSINSSTFDTGAAGTDTTDIVGKLRGTYTFDITLGATTETVSVTINTGQTNTTVLNNIRNAINAAGIPDVTASVAAGVLTIDNASTDTLTLTQTSAGTAGTNLFSAIGLATTVGRSSSANSSTFTGTERDIAGTINPTTYTFTIGETTTGNVTVTTGQTNDTVLSNIAAALNNKFRDLTASVAGGQLTITNTDLNNVTLANATNLLNASGIGLTSATVTSGGGTVTSATFDTGSGAGTTDLAGKVDPATYNFTLTSTDTTGTVTVSPTQVNSVVLTNIENATNGILTGLTASGGATGTLTVTNGTGGTLTFTQTSGAGNLFTETGISTPLLPGSSDTSSPTHSDPAGTTLAGSIGPSTETITISGTNNPETGADFTATLSGISITSGRTNGQLLQDVRNAINGNTTLNAREVSAKNTATSTVAITNGTGASITVTDSGNDLLQKLGFGTGGTSMTITSTAGTNHIVSSKISDATNTITLDSSILDKFRYRITGSLGGTAEVIIGATDSDVTILTNIRDAINSAGAGNPRITINGPISTVTATLTTDNRLRITSSSIVTISDADSAGDPSTDTSVDNLIRVLNFDVPAANSTSLVGRIDSNAFTGTTRVPTLASGTYSFSLTLNNSDTSTTGDTRTVTGTVSVATTDDTNEEVLTRVANAINSAVSTINTADRVTASLPTESTGLRRLIITSNTTGPSSMIFGLTDTTTISASTANTQKFLTSTTTPTTSTHTSMTAGRYLINSLSGTVGKSAINQATYSASEGVILLPLDIKQTSGSSGYTRRGNELYAVFSLNGTVLFREKNEVSDAITGATFELKNSTLNTTQQTTFLNNLNPTSTTTTISPTPSGITTASVQLVIGQSSTDVRASIGKFIDSYNALVQFLIDNQKLDTSDPGNPVRGKLSSDVAYSNLQRRLTEIVFSTVTPLKTYTDNGQLTGGLSGDPSRLQDIGITVDEAGKLQLSTASRIVTPARIKDGKVETTSDSAVFDSKLSSNLAGVTHLFNFNGKDQNGNTITGATKGIAVQMKELLDGFARTGGIVSLSKRGLNLRIGNVDDQIGFVLRLISTRQDLILEELEKLQIALNLVSAQKAFTQSFFLVGFFQSAILGTST
jgi:flagellar capping protein FliD